jgi:hypothetical protein
LNATLHGLSGVLVIASSLIAFSLLGPSLGKHPRMAAKAQCAVMARLAARIGLMSFPLSLVLLADPASGSILVDSPESRLSKRITRKPRSASCWQNPSSQTSIERPIPVTKITGDPLWSNEYLVFDIDPVGVALRHLFALG